MSNTVLLPNTRILVTNDDGIHAPGLKVLEKIAAQLSDDVWVVGPETEQSGVGHGLSLHNPLRYQQLEEKRYSVRGTPTDCVLFAYEEVLNRKVDLVLSGVNRGCNLGEDVTHSGTVAAAMEGTLCGVPSIALSLLFEMDAVSPTVRWQVAEKLGAAVVQKIVKAGIPKGVLMNVNFPDCEPDECKGIRMVHSGRRNAGKQLDTRKDRKGRPYYWIHWSPESMDPSDTTSDLAVILQHYVTVTPINLDLTDYRVMEMMRSHIEG